MVAELRREHWPQGTPDDFTGNLRRDYLNPSGEPGYGEYLPGLWLRTIRRRTDDGSTISVINDISDLKKAELFLSDDFARIGEGNIPYDSDERIVMANQRIYDLYGHDPDVVKHGRANVRTPAPNAQVR